jgi:hypothetical protein
MELSQQQQHDVCLIVSVGCDRLAAAKYVGCSLADLRRAMQNVPQFAADVRRAEAAIEMTHMRNVQSAARDEKNWRASVWWLERRAPERYGRRDAGAVTAQQLEAFVAQLAAAVAEEVHDADDRQRLVTRLHRVAVSVTQTASEDEELPGWLGRSEATPQRSRGLPAVDPRHPPCGESTSDDSEDAECDVSDCGEEY